MSFSYETFKKALLLYIAFAPLGATGRPLYLSKGIFIMNYEKIYFSLMERAKTRIFVGYGEYHHIIPKSIKSNSPDKEEKVKLTAREHFIAHRLLVEITTGNDKRKMSFALWLMCNVYNHSQERYKPTSREYERIRKEHSERLKISNPLQKVDTKGKNNFWFGKSLPQKIKDKMKKNHWSKTGNYIPKTGWEMAKEQKNKLSAARIGKPLNKGRRLINTETGEVFRNVAALSRHLKVPASTLRCKFNGQRKNTTIYKPL